MPTLRVPALMKYYLDGATEIDLPDGTVAEVLRTLCARHPKIEAHIFDQGGKLRRHVNLFVNTENIRDLNGLDTPLKGNDIIRVVPSVTGG